VFINGTLWSSAKSNRTRLGSSLAEAELDGDNVNGKKNKIASPNALIVEPITCRVFCIIGCAARFGEI